MSEEEFLDALLWVDERFHIIRPPPDGLPGVDYVLERARLAVMRCVWRVRRYMQHSVAGC
jgi:hypothetical protein